VCVCVYKREVYPIKLDADSVSEIVRVCVRERARV